MKLKDDTAREVEHKVAYGDDFERFEGASSVRTRFRVQSRFIGNWSLQMKHDVLSQ